MFEAWGAGKRFGFVPVHDQMVYWFATANTNTGNIIEKFRHFFSPIPELIEATPSQTIIETNIYDLKPLSRLVKGRVALLGDAAHPMTPNLGQGACMAIEDAVILASCLKKSSEPQDAFLEYERKRHKLVSLMVNTSRQFGMIGQIQCPLLCRMRNLAVQAVPKKFQERQLLKTFRFLGE